MADPNAAKRPTALEANSLNGRQGSSYPEPFRSTAAGRVKRALGDPFGLTQYGVNLVEMAPGSWSSQRHWHTHEDELVYVLEGELVLITDAGEQVLRPGMVAGFEAGETNGHHLVNRSNHPARYLEVGSRIDADEVYYPDIDLELRRFGDRLRFVKRSGEPY